MKEPRGKARSRAFVDSAQAERRRWTDTVKVVLAPAAGTLWWVEESLWQEKLRIYDRRSTRQAHPGLSALQHPVQDLFSQVPLLHGTSGSRGPVVATGLSEDAPEHQTSFGHLVAPAVPVIEWTPLSQAARVRPNLHKPRLDLREQAVLLAFLRRRGLA